MDKRHLKREHKLQKLFSLGFENIQPDPEVRDIAEKLPELDKRIEVHASRYPLQKIAKVDLAVLRLAIYELLYNKQNPPKVVIDEAVTLAREYGNDKSYAFVNGVLGSVLKEITN